MLGDMYLRFTKAADYEPIVRRWTEIWWPLRNSGPSYIYIQGSRMALPDHFTPAKLPTIETILEAIRNKPDRFWLAEGSVTLEWAEVSKVESRWTKLGNGSKYLSQIGYSTEIPEFETLSDVSVQKLRMRLNQTGILTYSPIVPGGLHGPLESLWH